MVSLFLLSSVMQAYDAKAEVTYGSREIKVNIQYTFSSESATITIPQRSRLQLIAGSNQQTIPVYQNGYALTLSKLSEYGKKVTISYIVPTTSEEFFLEEWLPLCSEQGTVMINTVSPQGYRFIIFPYEKRMENGYIVNPERKVRLIFGRYELTDDSYNQQKITILSHMKLQTDIKSIFTMLKTMGDVLFPLPFKNIDFVTLPAWQGNVYGDSNQTVVIIGNTTPDAFKTAVASLYFSSLSNKEWRQGLIDYYRRLLADDGNLQTDEGFRLHIPSDAYYQQVLQRGFPSTEKIVVDVPAMEKNFILLQFGFFTVSEKQFHKAVRTLLASPTNLNWDIAVLFETTNDTQHQLIQWASEKLLPVFSYVPDISIKQNALYRNFTEVDFPILVDNTPISVSWNNGRVATLPQASNNIRIDPQRLIPQWNYANDLWFSPEFKTQWESVLTAAQNHKLLPTDTTREILYARRFIPPSNNPWNIPSNTPTYVVITRVYTTYQNRMTVALKELIITVSENRPNVIAYRLRI